MSQQETSNIVILVTGGNRGIGFAIVKSLAVHPRFSSATILLGCRDIHQGQAAIQQLQMEGIQSCQPLELDVTSDSSIYHATAMIGKQFGQLDVLINNAGYAAITSAEDFSDLRQMFQDIYNVNVTSVAMLTRQLLPLLRRSNYGGKVIQVGSARGSISRLVNGELPPTVAVGYSISKTALNALTLQMSIETENSNVEFQIASPGHCKTAFNGYRGTRDPAEGAVVVVELAIGARKETRMWETTGASRDLEEVPW